LECKSTDYRNSIWEL